MEESDGVPTFVSENAVSHCADDLKLFVVRKMFSSARKSEVERFVKLGANRIVVAGKMPRVSQQTSRTICANAIRGVMETYR